ncbi:MAG: Gfo/Idh/MocA family oxidoreductase [Puniceicoccales bacterium]|jgi:predicted dehydrogenase|nr:Gfo/Idh/MocA family oxidoreductase [Puniceicoccales bacterium]
MAVSSPSSLSVSTAQISRRRFLRQAGATLAIGAVFPALIPARALGRDGTVSPSNRITLGVIGTSQGMANVNRFLPFPDVQVNAVCEVDGQRLTKAVTRIDTHYGTKGTRSYRDFREMFARAKLDAVIIAAPDHWHGIMAVRAARAGIDIYGEKPLAHTLAEGRAVVDAVKQHGCVWQTGSWQRSIANFRRAVELVRNGRIGRVSHVEVGTHGGTAPWREAVTGKPPAHLDYEMWVGPAVWTDYDPRVTHSRWRWVLNYGGGRLMDFVGHHVDIAQWGLGLDHTGPVKISGTGTFATTPPYDAEHQYRYDCIYENGVVMAIGSDFTSGTRFYGERGWIHVGRSKGLGVPGHLEASSPAILQNEDGANDVHIYRSDDHWRNFIDCVKTRRETITPVEIAHRVTNIGHLGHIAIQTGRTIHWDPAAEVIKNDPAASLMLQPVFSSSWAL